MNYFEKHLGDFIKNTAHLTMLEEGAYNRLIDLYYTRECALPVNIKECCKLARALSKPEREAVSYILAEYFELREDGYHQSRCDEEIARFKDKQAKAKRSANARWGKHQLQSEGNSSDMRTHSEGNAPRAPVTNHQSPVTNHHIAIDGTDCNSGVQNLVAITCANGAFPMHHDWQPGERFSDSLALSGLKGYDWEDDLAEFVLYRMGQSERMSQGSWEHRFIKTIKHNIEQRKRAGNSPTQIPVDWEPPRDVVAQLKQNGVTHKFLDEQLLEFVAFWRDAGNYASSWTAKFIKHVNAQWAHYTPPQKSTFENLIDRSWAIGHVPGIEGSQAKTNTVAI